MKKLASFLILTLAACGGAEPASFGATGDDSGTGGEDEGEAGGDSTGSEKSAGGAGGSSSSSSSGQCQPSVSCQSVGAECGTILDDGCGNEIECPDNCTGNLTCGGSGDQFKCGCTPLTCLDLEANCGVTDDGCGGTIECGSCGNNPYVSCGGDSAPNEFGQPGEPGEENICGGGCTKQQTAFAQTCQGMLLPPTMYLCTTESSTPPFADCEPLDQNGLEDPPIEDTWCCEDHG